MLCFKRCVCAIALFCFAISSQVAHAAITVFSDNFNRASLGATWTTTATGDGGASIVGTDRMQLTNDASGTANTSGRVYSTTPTASFPGYSTTLNLNPAIVTWSFNFQQERADPSGFDGGNYGTAFVLGGSNSDFTLGNGYAVVVGQSGTTDPLRLVSYAGGLDLNANLTDIIASSGGGSTDLGTQFLSVKVTYNPVGNAWEMFTRDDLGTFADPLVGALTSVGTATNGTHTGIVLSHLGTLWNFNTAATQESLFDNFVVSVPEPSSLALFFAGALFVMFCAKRRQALTIGRS